MADDSPMQRLAAKANVDAHRDDPKVAKLLQEMEDEKLKSALADWQGAAEGALRSEGWGSGRARKVVSGVPASETLEATPEEWARQTHERAVSQNAPIGDYARPFVLVTASLALQWSILGAVFLAVFLITPGEPEPGLELLPLLALLAVGAASAAATPRMRLPVGKQGRYIDGRSFAGASAMLLATLAVIAVRPELPFLTWSWVVPGVCGLLVWPVLYAFAFRDPHDRPLPYKRWQRVVKAQLREAWSLDELEISRLADGDENRNIPSWHDAQETGMTTREYLDLLHPEFGDPVGRQHTELFTLSLIHGSLGAMFCATGELHYLVVGVALLILAATELFLDKAGEKTRKA